tara:strand:- start:4989 stop:6416 length:1428 start_codon:yes stop_codon:yes gene_type:complete
MAEADEFTWKEAEHFENIKLQNARIIQKMMTERMNREDKLMRERRMLEVMTRIPNMGGVGGGAMGLGMGFLQNIIGTKFMGFNRLKDLQDKEAGGETLTSEELKEKDMLSGQKRSNSLFQRLDKTFDKHFGGDSKWNKFFAGQGKAAALGMGAGAAAGGMMLGKAIIDSSPMFQQMLKLLNFGIMMILRPIGDFFGFLMRPIMIMLLRKFIIPFYQEYMPIMQEMGDYIGNIVAPVLEKILLGVTGVVQLLAAASPIAMLMGKSNELYTAGMANLQAALQGDLNTNVVTPELRDAGAKITEAVQANGTLLAAKYEATASALTRLTEAPTTKASSEAITTISKQIGDWTTSMSSVLTREGLMKVGRYTTETMAGLKEGRFENAEDAMYWFAQQMFKGGVNKYAQGGIINEPIMGVGRSGQAYMFGESGAESVTPLSNTDNKSVVINVYGDVDQNTMQTFERKVLEVLGRSNARRGL